VSEAIIEKDWMQHFSCPTRFVDTFKRVWNLS